MRAWAWMLGGMIVWAVHFFAVYIVASVFLTTDIARILTVMMTLACLAADGWLIARLRQARAGTQDSFSDWMRWIALGGAGLSLVAVLWQGLPALLV
ncbi:hypothetical protein CA236_09250 [Sphingomonas sp. ABOLG]|jgi:hypothetical protein|uniref:Uncharacterized protein n=1 Tax=Sphingomonas olei TaxID=1886787 RepID=A0ABY2QJ89_9SPHN|nr:MULTISPECIES: hypothetical protein [Sphingomonas]RSV18267.1 hypothetical protein CA236_09250 [Sphingomonas sp. ABOLG]THG40969.1 hypothetical protein E5988_05130 [Sphingomonas olei]